MEQAEGIVRVVVHWPGPVGSIDDGVLAEFARLIAWIEDEKPCRALMFEARASRSGNSHVPPDVEHCRKWEMLLVRVDRLPCISVAVVDGPCTRQWMQLALACDHRIATKRSSFRVEEAKEGYLPGMNIFRLAKYVGIGVARRLVFTAESIDSHAAAGLGIVDEVSEVDGLEAATARFMARLEPIHPVTVQLARRLLNESFSTTFEQFLGQYLASQQRCLSIRERELKGT